jgi:hypothetical protein
MTKKQVKKIKLFLWLFKKLTVITCGIGSIARMSTSRLFIPKDEASPRYPLVRPGGPHSWSGRYKKKEKKIVFLPAVEPRPSSPCPIIEPTELSKTNVTVTNNFKQYVQKGTASMCWSFQDY